MRAAEADKVQAAAAAAMAAAMGGLGEQEIDRAASRAAATGGGSAGPSGNDVLPLSTVLAAEEKSELLFDLFALVIDGVAAAFMIAAVVFMFSYVDQANSVAARSTARCETAFESIFALSGVNRL